MRKLSAEMHVDADVGHHNMVGKFSVDPQSVPRHTKLGCGVGRGRTEGPDCPEEGIECQSDILFVIRVEVRVDLFYWRFYRRGDARGVLAP